MQQLLQAENVQTEMSPISLYNKFIERIRSHLHVILAFSPIGDGFKNNLRMFPALINCCTIDWFHEWPDDALELVAHKFLDDVEINDQIRHHVVNMCKLFHKNLLDLSAKFYDELHRRNYVTPTSYLELIKTFKDLLDKKRFEILSLKERYVIGMEKLELSESQISIMQKDLTELQPKMIKTSQETEDLIMVFEREAGEVDAVKQIVEADKEKANKATMEAQLIKDECEEQLELAIPALNEAISALDTLKPQDISGL
jgi:dynein heavy chain